MTPTERLYLTELCTMWERLAKDALKAHDQSRNHDPAQAFGEHARAFVYRVCRGDLESFLRDTKAEEEADNRAPGKGSENA